MYAYKYAVWLVATVVGNSCYTYLLQTSYTSANAKQPLASHSYLEKEVRHISLRLIIRIKFWFYFLPNSYGKLIWKLIFLYNHAKKINNSYILILFNSIWVKF